METEDGIDRAFGEAVGRLGSALLSGLAALEATFRRLHPPDLPALRPKLLPLFESLESALAGLVQAPTPEPLEEFRGELVRAAESARDALSGLATEPRPEDSIGRVILAMHQFARAQATLYPLRSTLPPVSAFFAEPFRHGDLSALEAPPEGAARVGLFRSGQDGARGGFDLYVPESWDGVEALPLVVALHGGSGNGADFLWSWLREARSRRVLLLAPTSSGSTWSFDAPGIDGGRLAQIVEWVAGEWVVDRERILLTGLSDGATMTLLAGLGEEAAYTHLAPVSGVLHPRNFAIGNLDRAQDRPIHLVHGALDWMFPVALAQEAARILEDAGARLVYDEIADLSHTYPREVNARILEWLDPTRSVSVLASS